MPAIQTDELTKYYGEVRGVEDLSFAVEEGEVFGFLGPNGAGKTTTIRTLMGFQSPTGGTATVLGADIRDAGALREVRANVGYLPDDLGLVESVTGRRLLEYHGKLRGDVRSEEMLELFDPPLDRKVGEYSSGNKQMLAIVLAFMHDPDLLIMDEPTSGLDPLKQEKLHEFVRTEQRRGTTFFFSSHVLSEVRKVCDRVGIIRDGHLVELEDVDALLDRSGKRVRVRLGGRVDPGAFSIQGAHDVTITGDGSVESEDGAASDVDNPPASEAGDATASIAEEPATSYAGDARTSDAEDARTSDAGDATTSGADDAPWSDTDSATTVSFTYTGSYEPLLRRLLEYEVLDLNVEEAPLEDVFMRFYGENPAESVHRFQNDGPDRAAGDPASEDGEQTDV